VDGLMATNGQLELLVAQPKHDIPAHEPGAKTMLKVGFSKENPHFCGIKSMHLMQLALKPL
jgi:hypothetical protein